MVLAFANVTPVPVCMTNDNLCPKVAAAVVVRFPITISTSRFAAPNGIVIAAVPFPAAFRVRPPAVAVQKSPVSDPATAVSPVVFCALNIKLVTAAVPAIFNLALTSTVVVKPLLTKRFDSVKPPTLTPVEPAPST